MSDLSFEVLKSQVLSLENDAIAFEQKGNKAAGTRYRKGLQSIKILAQDIRKDVSSKKNG